MIAITILNSKGGTGKTTLALHLAWGLAQRGHRVLCIDNDFQGTLTSRLQGEANALGVSALLQSSADKAPVEELIQHTAQENLDLIGPGPGLRESFRAAEPDTIFELRYALEDLGEVYDFVLMDSRPDGGFELAFPLAASDYGLAAVTSGRDSVKGLVAPRSTIARLARGHSVSMLGYIMAINGGGAAERDAKAMLHEEFDDLEYLGSIGHRPGIETARSRQMTVFEAAQADRRLASSARAYDAVVTNFLEAIEKREKGGVAA